MIDVLATGPLATVQDLGRPGRAALGVGPSGAADRAALRLANRLIGNPEQAAAIEATLGGLRLRFAVAASIACTGTTGLLRVDRRPAGMNAPIDVPAGAEVALDRPTGGLRTYLAVRGGIDVPAVLGSRSTDLLSGIGPPVLAAGACLPIGPAPLSFPVVDVAPVPPLAERPVLSALAGPRDDWFAPAALSGLIRGPWTVRPDSNRIGVRLAGPALERRVTAELPSEGLVRGAVQVPADGQPILFLADHPITGGYPVIAVVDAAGADRAAQLRPGDAVRFRVSRFGAAR